MRSPCKTIGWKNSLLRLSSELRFNRQQTQQPGDKASGTTGTRLALQKTGRVGMRVFPVQSVIDVQVHAVTHGWTSQQSILLLERRAQLRVVKQHPHFSVERRGAGIHVE